ncbi:class I SAM-dependent methyltransferase [Sphingomonas sp. SUN019]|uniref:class I SAM-dependent methyltransferase n=1 Tax=Sphingomonas sp. SUN019 TaxID=2937788 RepID=UPI0021646B94|nr:class I SAM-dependent methyltransferase [Sphingomonas sp. SUN019]UVO51695.1 class I SAM-dependent methyltransferase [Sphingomonas sp. SUN019]
MNDQLHECRACLAPKPYLFLPMGDHPPANMFVRAAELAEVQPSFALNTQACLHCGLIQVADQIPADFFRHYLYVPSGADTMHTHFGAFAEVLTKEAEGGLIVDIGANDGLLLRACNALGAKTLGVDPAANLAEIAKERGVEIHVAYFDPKTAETVRKERGPAKVIVTTNTFNHIGDLHNFMAGVEHLLAPDGVFVIEVPWARKLLEHNEFDTVYQEHVSEFSLLSLQKLGAFFDLEVVDVDRLTVHGGSMRVFLRHTGTRKPTAAVADMLQEERDAGMLDADTYDKFADRISAIGKQLAAMLGDLKGQGLKVAGYGAPAKGNTLLNYFGIGPDKLDFLVDRNPLKHGLYSPGMKIPVRDVDAIAEERPDVLMVLAWNFFDEIRAQQTDFTARGGRFLVPLPQPTLVS